jgi:hypothetical protein
MRRREFITLLGGTAIWPLAASAQQAEGMAHVGLLGSGADNTLARIGYQAFSTELQKLGFTQGKNLQLDYRRTDQGMDLAVAAARELVAAKANVIVAMRLGGPFLFGRLLPRHRCPRLAQSGHDNCVAEFPLLAVKRTIRDVEKNRNLPHY